MVTEFLDSKNLCMAVKELCSYVVHILGLRYEYLLIVGRHLDFITSLSLHNMGNSYIEFIELQNMGVAVRIVQFCFIQAEI